jgi:hypothetical protein
MSEPQLGNIPVKASPLRIRLRAAAMQLIADLNGRYVEMHIVTDRGQTLVVACDNQTLIAMQRELQQFNQDIQDIAEMSDWDPSDTVALQSTAQR